MDSTSIRHHLPFDLLTYLQVLWFSARMSVLSIRTRIRLWRCFVRKLYLLQQAENAEKAADIKGDVKDIDFGNQIRSYVLQPYTMVKDHRTNKEIGNAQSVLDGKIDPFISAYLIWITTGKKADEE